MIRQRAFFFYHGITPGVGTLAENEFEGWQRVNLYAFGVDMDALQKDFEEMVEEGLTREGIMGARSAQSKVIVAGGVVFKGLTLLAGEGHTAERLLSEVEKGIDDFRVVTADRFKKAEGISPLEVYCFSYQGKVIGISRVVFFEYATQFSMAGICRDQDHHLVDELYERLSKLHSYMTVPSPLRTDEKDQRVELNMFMIRFPLKEELQAEFVSAINEVPGLEFYTA